MHPCSSFRRTLLATAAALVLLSGAPGLARTRPVETIHTKHTSLRQKLTGFIRGLKPRSPGGDLARLGRRLWRSPMRWFCRRLHRRRADLVVLSDLHVGPGRDKGEVSKLEDFRAERHLGQLVDHLIRRQHRSGRPLKVVLAGDIFDFVKTTSPPKGERWPASADADRDTRPTERVALMKLRRIIQGHPRFLPTLRRLIAAGHEVVIVPGNHDVELNFPTVQRELRKQLGAAGVRKKRLKFAPWFHMHGGALIEHGQRYEPLTCLANMLHPFEGEGSARRLRSSAANYLVAEMLNRIKTKIPNLNYLPSGDRMLLEVIRKAPDEAAEFVRFVDRIGERMGRPDPQTERTQFSAHQSQLRSLAASKLGAVNRSRSALGMTTLSQHQLELLLERFDRNAARPHLWRASEGEGWQRTVRLLQPQELKQWLFPADHSTLREGQAFALTHLAHILVTGHTHSASHRTMGRGRHKNHLVDTGTWTPVTEPGTDRPIELLTYADIRQLGGRPTVRLRRWDPRKKRAVTITPQRIREGQFLSEELTP